jgi:hypothetical protein
LRIFFICRAFLKLVDGRAAVFLLPRGDGAAAFAGGERSRLPRRSLIGDPDGGIEAETWRSVVGAHITITALRAC